MPVQRPSTRRYRSALYEDAVAIVDREYATDLSLDDIARRIATSRRQPHRSFTEVGGTPLRDPVTAVRMDKAAQLLTHPRLTVGQVSKLVGYRQPAQFAKAFRRRHGAAPAVYRRTPRPPEADAPEAPARPSDG